MLEFVSFALYIQYRKASIDILLRFAIIQIYEIFLMIYLRSKFNLCRVLSAKFIKN